MAGVPYVGRASLSDRARSWMAAVSRYHRGRPAPALTRSALVLVDLQRYFADPDSHAYLPALDAVLPGLIDLARRWFSAGRPLVITRHVHTPDDPAPSMRRWWSDIVLRGEPRAELVPELAELCDELSAVDPERVLVLDKAHYSAFVDTDLQPWLEQRGCDAVVVGGVMTHLCCETTARDAFMRGLAPVVLADGCASVDEDLHLGALRALSHGFCVVCTAEQAAEVLDPAAPSDVALPSHWDRRKPAELPRSAELVVVGAGPAGITAAIQARRQGLTPLVIDPGPMGGLALTAQWVENYLGFPGGIGGRELMDRFRAQASGWQVVPARAEVTSVQRIGDTLQVFVHDGRAVQTRAVILATGTLPRGLPLPDHPHIVTRVDALPRRGIERALVVGGGEAAVDQAMLCLDQGARSVEVAARGPTVRAMKLLSDRAEARGVRFAVHTRLTGVVVDGQKLRATLSGPDGDRQSELDAVVVCIGRRPTLPRLPDGLRLNERGLPRVDRLGRTDLPGLYLAGDLCRGITRQVAVAAGDGLAAAMHATRFLRGKPWRTQRGT